MIRIFATLVGFCLLMPGVVHAYGEPSDGHPNMEELWIEVFTSSCRHDPAAWQHVWGSPSYSPMGPLWHHHGLNVVARMHSQDMADNDCFSHDSCDGTPWDTRISAYYGGGGFGENIAAGYWSAYEAMDGWLNSEGHRENIYTSGYQELGTGVAWGGSYGIYWTQDFGMGAPADRHPVPTAAAELVGNNLEVWAIAYDTGGAPDVMLGHGNDCYEMDLIYGDAGNGTYEAVVPAAGENRWNIQVRTSNGNIDFWPDSGSWTDTSYDSQPPAADCFAVGDDDDDASGDDDASDDDNGTPAPFGGGTLVTGQGCDCGGGGGDETPFGRPPVEAAALLLLVWFRRRSA